MITTYIDKKRGIYTLQRSLFWNNEELPTYFFNMMKNTNSDIDKYEITLNTITRKKGNFNVKFYTPVIKPIERSETMQQYLYTQTKYNKQL